MQPEDPKAGSMGAYLRALRESKAGLLEDMSRSTRVGVRHLEALEDERLADLPSPVFVKGFIRAYCSFLGEPPDEALARYRELSGEHPSLPPPGASQRTVAARNNSSVVVGLSLLVILGSGLAILNLTVKRAPQTSAAAVKAEPQAVKAEPQNVEAPAPPAPAAPPAHVAATPPPPAPLDRPGARGASLPQRLVVKAVEPTWIRVQTDDGRVAEELLPAGATREWTAERRFVLTVGNAGGVELELNGTLLPPLGARGAVIQRLELPQPAASTGS